MLNSLTSNDSIRPNTVGVVDLHATNMAATVICESCVAFLLFNSFGTRISYRTNRKLICLHYICQ